MKSKLKALWDRSAYWVGMALFFISVIYSVYKAPDILWNLDLRWLSLVVLFILVMFAAEIGQFFIFLRHHNKKLDLLIPIRFTTRKSILNSLLPAKTGTLLFLHLITRHYKLAWHEYVQYMVTATVMLLVVSGMAFLGLILPLPVFVGLVISLLVIAWIVGRVIQWGYLGQTFPLLLVSIAIYGCRLLIFWALLRSAGNDVGLTEASYFAIATNTLAQVSITPGNIGIREVIFGLMSPYLSLPMSVGVIIGAIFQVVRIVVYGIIMLGVDLGFRERFADLSIEPSTPDKA